MLPSFLFLSDCLHMFVCLSVSRSVCLSVVCLFVDRSVCLSVCLSACLSVGRSVRLYVCFFFCFPFTCTYLSYYTILVHLDVLSLRPLRPTPRACRRCATRFGPSALKARSFWMDCTIGLHERRRNFFENECNRNNPSVNYRCL